MKPNTQESIDHDNQLIAELIETNPALVLAGAAISQRRCLIASDILEASGLDNFAHDVICSSVDMHGYIPATLAYRAHRKISEGNV